MKNLLTGVCNNITQHIDKILLWKNSFESVVDNGEVVLIAYNPSPNDIEVLKQNNITYHGIKENSSETVNNMRLLPMSEFLKDNFNNYSKVLYTDVFDVAFTKDPFQKLDTDNYDIFVAGEGIVHNSEPWNMDVMAKCFPQYVQAIKQYEIFCSGVIAGKPLELSRWLKAMNDICLTSKKGHDIEDQAAMNILIMQNVYYNKESSNTNTFIERFKIKYFNLKDNWAIHLATGGPTQFFEPWGFKNSILKRYGIVPNWKDYDIVHQFNRIPEIHKEIIKRYE